ncbi:hypothetical protein EIP86_003730, partial [Pleurotus ostreatoroseus]
MSTDPEARYMLHLSSKKVTSLTENNYHTWKSEMMMVFYMDSTIDGIISGTIRRPAADEAKGAITQAAWDAKDRLTLTLIWSTVSKELGHLVLGRKSGLEAWKALQA